MSLDRVYGLVGWTVRGARLSQLAGSSLMIELGGCLVLINDAAWRLEDEQDFLVGSGDDRDYVRGMITELDGRTLTTVTVSKFLDLTLDFDGLRLITFALPAADHQWSVQFEDDTTFFAGPVAGGTDSSHQPRQ
ncbi:hypothetical protein KIPE111705_27975 [Kibdelosporangium persicum]|uniref:Uncharacterized protein n=1 Tax=Kibdelosporangium persicum TaxID=2698649 RepID=A0ABX2FFY7_9PSEU|nr:hypothetical protein [Kibdelosporangium persicum]NRN70309.1 hypothetical protein [Kibdelosporangium persicum]